MGTETYLNFYFSNNSCFKIVKLNNPLMGTETSLSYAQINVSYDMVKLNNPLMGTETRLHLCR